MDEKLDLDELGREAEDLRSFRAWRKIGRLVAHIRALEAERDALRKDAECFQWLVSEHDRIDPVVAVVWKAGAQRKSSECVNTISGNDLISTCIIEMNAAAKDAQS